MKTNFKTTRLTAACLLAVGVCSLESLAQTKNYTKANIDEAGSVAAGFNGLYVSNEDPSRVSIVDILNQVYGTTFSNGLPVGDTNQFLQSQTLSNAAGTITATRITDFYTGTNASTANAVNLNLDGSNMATATDRLWNNNTGGQVMIQAEAKFATNTQTFGWRTSGGTYNDLFTVNTNGFLNGTPTTMQTLGSGFEWYIKTDNDGETEDDYDNRWRSKNSSNTNSEDKLVTYYISGTGVASPSWMLFWEDLSTSNSNFDGDFNDLAVQIKIVSAIVPVPSAAWMGISALGLVATGSSFIRRKTAVTA